MSGKQYFLFADDRSIVIKKADKGSCVVWDRSDYAMEAEKQFNDTEVCKNISDSKYLILKLTETSKRIFKSLKWRGFISEKQLKYFRFDFKKASNLENFIFCPNFTRECLTYLVSLLSQIVVHLQKKFLNFWTVIFNSS